MALREVLAELDMQVRGLGKVEAADHAVDRFKESLSPAIREVDRLRIKSAEYGETASKLAQQIRKLQKAGGDNSAQIAGMRVAHGRLTAASAQARTAASKLDGTWKESTGGLSSMVAGFTAATAVIGSIVAATAVLRRAFGAVSEAVAEVIHEGDALNDMSVRVGISAGALQEWQYAAERSGVSAEAMQKAIMVLARNAAGPGAKGLRALGIATEDASGQLRSREALFGDTIAALAGMTNGTERAAAAQAAFGRSGGELLTLIDEGPEGIARLRDRFRELGGGLSDDVVRNAAAADDALVDFRTAMTSLRGVLVSDVLPALTWMADKVATVVGGFAELMRHSSAMQVALGLVGASVVALGLLLAPVIIPFAAPILAVVAAFALLFLAVEDVVTAFRGGDSVFGGFVEWVLQALGITTTFAGAIDQIGLGWQVAGAMAQSALADIVEGVARVQVALGLMDPASAARDIASSRTRANNALAQLPKARAVAAGAEAARMIDRAIPAAAEVQTRKAAGERVRGGRGKGVTANATIIVNGAGDAAAVAREVSRQHTRRIREAVDTLPLAPEAG